MTDGEIRASYRQAKYPHEQIRILSQLTDKSEREIRDIIGLPVGSKGRYGWSSEELEFLKANLHLTDIEIGEKVGKNERAVSSMRHKLNMVKKHNKWSNEEKQELKEAYNSGISLKRIAGLMGKSYPAVASKVYQMKMKGEIKE